MPTSDMAVTLMMEGYYQHILFLTEMIDRREARRALLALATKLPDLIALAFELHLEEFEGRPSR